MAATTTLDLRPVTHRSQSPVLLKCCGVVRGFLMRFTPELPSATMLIPITRMTLRAFVAVAGNLGSILVIHISNFNIDKI